MSEPALWWFRKHIGIEAAGIPGTTEIIRGNCTSDTFKRWEDRTEELGLKFLNPIAVFQDAACRLLPPGRRADLCAFVDENSPEIIRKQRIITWDDVKRFFVTLKAKLKSDEVVSEAEVERRAGICACCVHNQKVLMPGGCPTCNGALSDLANFLVGYKSSLDAKLESCEICGCNNSSQIHFPLAALKEYDNGALTYPNFCWKAQPVSAPA